MQHRVIYVSGGCKSGKSSFALDMARKYFPRVFVATAQALDTEMDERIRRHREERGSDFNTMEEPLHLAGALSQVPSGTQVALIDCLTLWAANLMHQGVTDTDDCPQLRDLLRVLESPPCTVILVSNELGMGLVPGDSMSRRYRDLTGKINQLVAARADEAHFLVSGLPLQLK